MAFSNVVLEVQTGGDDTNNGGGFNTGSTFASDGAATSATGTTPLFSSASYNFVAGDVGHFLFIKSGTNWLAGWYEITAVSANKATLDAAPNHMLAYDGSVGISGVRSLIPQTGCATTASPTNATWGVDYSHKSGGAPIIAFTDLVIQATTTQFRSAANPVGKNFIGNIISIVSGTGFTVQRVAIISTSTITATCDKSLGTTGSTGGTGSMGGALASIGLASGIIQTGFIGGCIFVKAGSYSITSATASIAGGVFTAGSGETRLEGYETRRGDMGTAPVFTASGIATCTLIAGTLTSSHVLKNLTADGASLTAIRCFGSTANFNQKLVAKNATNSGFLNGSNGVVYYDCVATGCSTAGAGFTSTNVGDFYYGCAAYANTVTGFSLQQDNVVMFCIAANNTGATSDGFGSPAASARNHYTNCTSYGNGRDGWRNNTGTDIHLVNCVAEGNGGWGFFANGAVNNLNRSFLKGCAFYNNPSGAVSLTSFPGLCDGYIEYTASAFTNPAANDFSLNNVLGGGRSLRGAAFPGAFGGAMGSTGYLDIGAVQAPFAVTGYVAAAYGSFG